MASPDPAAAADSVRTQAGGYLRTRSICRSSIRRFRIPDSRNDGTMSRTSRVESTSRATSADVARASGVSRATVSYVLNNKENRNISPATRALVLDKARELGHVPHASARALRLGRSHVILALVSDFTFGYIRDEVLAALDVELTRRGYVLMVHRYAEGQRPLAELWPLLSPDVVVSLSALSSADTDTMNDARIKLVEVQSLLQPRRAGQMQAEYLYAAGHRFLGYAYPTRRSIQTIAKLRLAGTRAACKRLGLPPLVVTNIDRRQLDAIEHALDEWLQGPQPVTAVCAHNDELAVMIALAMSKRGLQPGRDLAIMGIDDIPIASLGITTISIDLNAVTERIVEMVVATLEGREPKISRTPPLRLVRRESA